MHLGEEWYNCVMVYDAAAKQVLPPGPSYHEEMTNKLEQYAKENPHAQFGNIWYDTEENTCFGTEQYKRWRGTSDLPKKDHSFFTSKEDFIDGSWGTSYVKQALRDNDVLKNQTHINNEECIIGFPPSLEKYKGKSVMIVGGGPSANEIKWENVDTDFVWSINKFYLNDRVAKKKVDLATIASHIDLKKEDLLHEYIKNNDTMISFELERGNPTGEYEKFLEIADFASQYPDNTSFFHTRYKSQPGVGMRFLCYAILLGLKDIYFVGIDGFAPQGPLHSFEKDKENPNWYIKFGDRFQKRQYIIFWDYIMGLKKKYDYNIYNLGENHSVNISGEISKKICPLPKEVAEKIDG